MKRQKSPSNAGQQQSGLVPYITRWSAEQAPALRVVAKNGGIGYADERPYDRDTNGVLWTRIPSVPGKGRSEFGKVHAVRQRRAMEALLCQVCAGPADRTADGVLWMSGENPDELDGSGSASDELITAQPPLCSPCAVKSAHACPHLRRRCTVLRARAFDLVGVRGALYRPGYPSPVAWDAISVAFDDPRIRWIRAGQALVRLRGITVAGLDALRGSAVGTQSDPLSSSR
ncbi:hypothetical protein P3L51_07300 [Streptomyces sp. PSRA5]|uniref:hypothetical protein n=1 Tax=Streptomyces panacea TaxID=3035064 RepID=UPI00339C6106